MLRTAYGVERKVVYAASTDDGMLGLVQIGQVLAGRYRILGPLAEGGMGGVYRAEHLVTAETVALKVLWPSFAANPDVVDRFTQEARLAARLKSAHVVRVLDAGSDEETGLPFLAMELLQGTSLQTLIDNEGAQPFSRVRNFVEQIAVGLDRAHNHLGPDGEPQPIVHCDLKPANLFLTYGEDGEEIVKILDFGISRILDSAGDASKDVCGSPLYMADEQVRGGEISARTDIWALGLVTYYLLTGKVYWKVGEGAGYSVTNVMAELLTAPIEAASERARRSGFLHSLPAGFDEWFGWCLRRDPRERFASALDAAAFLTKLDPKKEDPNESGTPQGVDENGVPFIVPSTVPNEEWQAQNANPRTTKQWDWEAAKNWQSDEPAKKAGVDNWSARGWGGGEWSGRARAQPADPWGNLAAPPDRGGLQPAPAPTAQPNAADVRGPSAPDGSGAPVAAQTPEQGKPANRGVEPASNLEAGQRTPPKTSKRHLKPPMRPVRWPWWLAGAAAVAAVAIAVPWLLVAQDSTEPRNEAPKEVAQELNPTAAELEAPVGPQVRPVVDVPESTDTLLQNNLDEPEPEPEPERELVSQQSPPSAVDEQPSQKAVPAPTSSAPGQLRWWGANSAAPGAVDPSPEPVRRAAPRPRPRTRAWDDGASTPPEPKPKPRLKKPEPPRKSRSTNAPSESRFGDISMTSPFEAEAQPRKKSNQAKAPGDPYDGR